MASIASFSGLASGIQWRDMIEQIISLESSRKLKPISDQITAAGKRRDAWSKYEGLLKEVSTAISGLKSGTAFGAFGVTVAKSATTSKELLSVTASTSAAPGAYSVEVRKLATSEKIRTASGFTSTSDARGLSGQFFVNGKAVTLSASDSLANIRDKINAVNSGSSPSGVTASIVTVSETEHYLTLTADATGERGIQLVDSGDGSSTSGVLQQLGVLTGAQSANTSAGKTESLRMSSKSTAVASLLGVTSPPAVTYINVGGNKVEVDLLNDSLEDVLDKIEAAGGSGTIESETVNGRTTYRIATDAVSVNTDAGTDQDDSRRAIELLGFVKGTAATVTQTGYNAVIAVDGLTVERRTNTITDAVAGLTLGLKAEELGTTVEVAVARDTSAIVASMEKFAAAFNKIVEFQDEQRKSGAPLYANASLRASVAALKDVILTEVPGIDPTSTDYTRTTVAGVSFDRDGKLQVNAETLKAALLSNFSEIDALFSSSSTTTASGIRSIIGSDTTASGIFAVNITQAAAVPGATATSDFPASWSPTGADQMTVVDSVSGESAVISLGVSSTIDSVIQSLNDAFGAQGMGLTASKSGNRLVVTGSEYGSAASFTVSYQQSGASYAGTEHTGLSAGTYAGLDVAGTINGEAATGLGQTLTADDGTSVDGLSFAYTGSTTGAVGTVSYGLGVAGELDRVIQGYTRFGDGLITLYMENIDDNVENLERREADVISRLDLYEQRLVEQFTAMEAAMSSLQNQGSWLTSQIAALPGYSDD